MKLKNSRLRQLPHCLHLVAICQDLSAPPQQISQHGLGRQQESLGLITLQAGEGGGEQGLLNATLEITLPIFGGQNLFQGTIYFLGTNKH